MSIYSKVYPAVKREGGFHDPYILRAYHRTAYIVQIYLGVDAQNKMVMTLTGNFVSFFKWLLSTEIIRFSLFLFLVISLEMNLVRTVIWKRQYKLPLQDEEGNELLEFLRLYQ